LAIVKKIVEEHAGRVTLDNVAPHGARVTLHFRARSAAVQRQGESAKEVQ
jgi:nitrogen fixation/metabolism regulation signal transduction histidine kinase